MNRTICRWSGLVITLIALSLALAGCTTDPAVAEVGGEKILKSEFDTTFNSYKLQYEKQYGADVWEQEEDGKKKIDTVREQILDMLIESRLVAKKSKELGVTVTDTELSKEIENTKGYFATDAKFNEFLTEQKMTLEYLTETIRKDLLFNNLYKKINEGTAVSDKEIEAYYMANRDQYQSSLAESTISIKDTLLMTKQDAVYEEMLNQMKASANIKKHLDQLN